MFYDALFPAPHESNWPVGAASVERFNHPRGLFGVAAFSTFVIDASEREGLTMTLV